MGRSIERKVHKSVLPRNCLNWSNLSLWSFVEPVPKMGVYERRWVRCFKRFRSRKIKNYPAIPRSTSHLRFDFSGCLFYLYSAGITDCILSWGRSSAGRALEWHSRGRRFDPDRLHQKINNLDAIEILSVCKLSAFCPCSLTDSLLKALPLPHPDLPGVIAAFPSLL